MAGWRPIILGLIVLAVVALGGFLALLRLPVQPATRTTAIVIGIYPVGARHPGRVFVFRAADGLTGTGGAPLDGSGCHTGDVVPAIREGTSLYPAPDACR